MFLKVDSFLIRILAILHFWQTTINIPGRATATLQESEILESYVYFIQGEHFSWRLDAALGWETKLCGQMS